MGFRLSKIITKKGDKGLTQVGDGLHISKGSQRIMAIGCIDELNSVVGVVRLYITNELILEKLITIQHQLLVVGAILAGSKRAVIQDCHLDFIEQWASDLMQQLEPVQDFILPGGTAAASYCHMARVVCRRAETLIVAADITDEIKDKVLPYINRLSDLFFMLAMVLNKQDNREEIILNRQI